MEFTQERMLEMFNKQIEIAGQFDDKNTAAIAARNRSFMSEYRKPRRWVSADESFVIGLEVVDFGDTWQVSTIGVTSDLHIKHYAGLSYDEATIIFDQVVSEQ